MLNNDNYRPLLQPMTDCEIHKLNFFETTQINFENEI